jgi:hypothetical protein
MTFKPAIWRPIAFVASVINLVAVGFAAGAAEAYHAAGHAGLALAFGLWAQRMQQYPTGRRQAGIDALEGEMNHRLETLESDMGELGRQLSEAQERLDFAERLLAQRSESPRVGPEH